MRTSLIFIALSLTVNFWRVPVAAADNAPINLVGEFPDSLDTADLNKSTVNTSTGTVEGNCKFDHNSGFEGFAMNFSCVSGAGWILGRLSIQPSAAGASSKVVWQGGATLRLFEGDSRWVPFNYACTKKDLNVLECVQSGKGTLPDRTDLNQMAFEIRQDQNKQYVLQTKSVKMPCEVKGTATSQAVKCFSLDGAFIGATAPQATNPWKLKGEFSLFFGPGNFLKMVTECAPAADVVTSCPALDLGPVIINSAGGRLTNREGMTAYFFDKDTTNVSNCNDACAEEWPPIASLLGNLAKDISVVTRKDGSKQVAYKGRPLYLYAGDTAVGDVKGDGYSRLWHVAKP